MTTPLLPIIASKRSPFLGDTCALCKEPFTPGDELVICPVDGARHHGQCWQANGNKCSALGCTGQGELADPSSPVSRPAPGREKVTVVGNGRTKIRTLPSQSFGCAQSCLILSVALAIVLIALGCFGLWAIFDYLMLHVWDFSYRPPLTGLLLPFNLWWLTSNL